MISGALLESSVTRHAVGVGHLAALLKFKSSVYALEAPAFCSFCSYVEV